MADDKVTEKAELLSVLQLRYFTAREVANLMCFPQEFGGCTRRLFILYTIVITASEVSSDAFYARGRAVSNLVD